MREACFCGESTRAERRPVYAGDGHWALRCPLCGHLDLIVWLPERDRRALIHHAPRRRSLLPAV